MEYKIIHVYNILSQSKALEKLVREVNAAISLGWEPTGGVSLTDHGSVAQAMVKRR